MNKYDAIEILEAAKYNLTHNIKAVGLAIIPAIEEQIQSAINILEKESKD